MGVISLGSLHPAEIDTPPPSIAPPPITASGIAGVITGGHRVPPTFVYVQRREPHMGPSYLMAPEDNSQCYYDLNIGWHEAPDPVRQSDFWAANRKINPQARMNVTSHIAIGSIEAVDEQQFRVGKLLGYFYKPMYAGMQQPSVMRSNIREAVPRTYGSQFQAGVPSQPAPSFTASGFDVQNSEDGYPY